MNLRDAILIEAFCQKLATQGLAKSICEQNRENLAFFANAYLESSEGMELKEVDADTMDYFLASWYPTKVKASRTELGRFISTFKKFYGFLYQLKVINLESHDEIIGVLYRKNFYLARLSPRRVPRSLRKADRPESLDGSIKKLNSPFWIDQSLYLLVHNLSKPQVPITLDFQLFLDYLMHHPIRLTPSTATLPRKNLKRLNQMMSRPEDLPASADQNHSQRMSLFYQLARCLDLFIVGPELELLVSPRAELFLELAADQQLVILIDALWNRLRWTDLENFGAQGFSGSAQEHRGGFAELLSRLPADAKAQLDGVFAQDRFSKMLTNYLAVFEVVENRIMFALKEMGIADYAYKPRRDPYLLRSHRGIASITLTKFGKKIMKYLARKDRDEMGGDSLLDLMEEGLIFL